MPTKTIMLMAALFASIGMRSQCNETVSSRIRSLTVTAGNRWMDLPVTDLNSGEVVTISFDDLTHERCRYIYKVEHCEADWTVSEGLFESDFADGFADGNTIDSSEESVNTNTPYTHYTLQIPNEKCKIKLSGNYKVTIYDENNANAVACRACFMVCENLMGVAMRATTNTDTDINGSHQQISMELRFGGTRVNNWQNEIKTVVMQNGRRDNAAVNARPNYVMADGLRWEHCKPFIFGAGNEYRKFEILDVSHTTMGLEKVDWDGKEYHAYLWTDEPRPSYVYDEDANGAFIIRNSDNTETNFTSDYMRVHFRLKVPRQNGEIYISGRWTGGRFLPEYRMEWNEESGLYECSIPLKLGYYNYQYLLMRPDGTSVGLPTEGNFHQTENVYQALIYYKGTGERTDRLVAFGKTGIERP